MNNIRIFTILISALLLMGSGIAIADDYLGTLYCLGRHVEGRTHLSIVLGNPNDDSGKEINIQLVRVLDGNGIEICNNESPWLCGDNECFPTRIEPNGVTWLGVHRMIRYEWCPGVENVHWITTKIIYSLSKVPTGSPVEHLYGRTVESVVDKRDDKTYGRATSTCLDLGLVLLPN
jgi:hypothetical protein